MTDFEKELIHYIFHVQDADDDNLSAEVICRKLYKYGLIDRGRGYWRPKKRPKYRWPARAIRKAEQTEPQTQLTAKCLECNNSKACKENHWQGCRYEPLGYEVTAVVGTMRDESQTDGYISGEDFMKIFDEPQTEVKGSERWLKSSEQSDAPTLTASGWKRIKEAMPECRLILFDDDGNYIEPQTERNK